MEGKIKVKDSFAKCECGGVQHGRSQSHENLQLISSIPYSSIYRCQCCGAFWMHETGQGWENLDNSDESWERAS